MQICLKNISKQYERPIKCRALCDINLEIDKGELIAITGKSGCGKSTLLNILAGLTMKSSGEYFFNNILLNDNRKHMAQFRQKNIGIVVQNFALLNDRTVFDNIRLGLVKNKMDKNKFYSIAEDLGIEKKLNYFPFQLSGGECQRVAIARAIIKKPSIILADEPTGALDSQTSSEIMKLFKDINKEGKTIIIVTHDLEIAKQCDRIIEISDGKIISQEKYI